MDTRKHMVITEGRIITKEVRLCSYNQQTEKYDLQFYTGKTYSYDADALLWLQEPVELSPAFCHISHDGEKLPPIDAVYVFTGKGKSYWHICFDDGNEADYEQEALTIRESALEDLRSGRIFAYLAKAASICAKPESGGGRVSAIRRGEMGFVGKETALSVYLNPQKEHFKKKEVTPIFPFGCSEGAYLAVKAALEHSISMIQGSSKKDRIQTVFNILANLLLQGRSVQVVFPHHAAMEQVLEKLSADDCPLRFLSAPIGNAEDKQEFLMAQTGAYPAFWSEDMETEADNSLEYIQQKLEEMKELFVRQTEVEALRQELREFEAECQRVEKSAEEMGVDIQMVKVRKSLDAGQLMQLWQECLRMAEQNMGNGLSFKFRCRFSYGISGKGFYKQDLLRLTTMLQGLFYRKKRQDLEAHIRRMEEEIYPAAEAVFHEIERASMQYLETAIRHKYAEKKERTVFAEADLQKRPDAFLEEYPILFSTADYAGKVLGTETVYSCVIVEEASQLDAASGALLLARGENAVLLGDGRELPEEMTADRIAQLKELFASYDIPEEYDCSRYGFLQSVKKALPEASHIFL
ncbi:MAG: hypothetical protein NC419_04805 [Muribaculaceae bacterium]|nr:hypothetical protein [Muribaculaceae bacterium]